MDDSKELEKGFEKLNNLGVESKKRFIEKHPTLKDVFNDCYCDIHELNKMIWGYKKMIIQNAAYNDIIQFEKDLENKRRDITSEFIVVTSFEEKAEKKHFFYNLDYKHYNLSDQEKDFVNKFSILVDKIPKEFREIFNKISLGVSCDVLEFCKLQEKVLNKMSKIMNDYEAILRANY